MRISKLMTTVDTHTEGEPTRIVTSGIGPIPGKSMLERFLFFKENLDHIRTALMAEPRGHKDMAGCVLTEPSAKEANYGMILMHNSGYMSMCGHATIGICTALAELGMVKTQEPLTRIVLESVGGLVEANVTMKDGRAESVSFINLPAYVDYHDVELDVPGLGKLKVDVAYGGNYFVAFSAEDINLEVRPQNIERVIDAGLRVLEAANKRFTVQHPELQHNNFINIATVLAKPSNPKATYKNVHVLPPRQFDHSPGGTGTSAMLAVLYARGQLRLNQEIWAESITGGLFKGRIIGETKVGNKRGVIPEISGCAYITGFHQFVIDQDDRLKDGFLIQ